VTRRSRAGATAALALSLAACMQSAAGSKRLDVRGPSWIVHGQRLILEARTLGALSVRDVSLNVSIDSDSVVRADTHAGRARIEVPARHVPAGRHLVTVKTGTESVRLEIRVLPAWQAVVVLLGGLVVVWLLARLVARRVRAA